MLTVQFRFLGSSYLAAILIGTLASASDSDQEATHSFKITIVANLDMENQGQKEKVAAQTELRYTWRREGRKRILSFESGLIKTSTDGKPLTNVFMSREKFTTTEQGKTEEVPFEKASDELKQKLQDCFGVPVCELQVDESGKELKRTVVAGPGARDLIDNGMIANALLFHPPFLRDKDEWQADTEVSMGHGGYVKGRLTYRKAPGRKDVQAVKVSGTLTNESFKLPGIPLTFKNDRYVIHGEETYAPAGQEWVSGKLAMDVSFQLTPDDKPPTSAKGTIIVSFEKLPGKQ